LSGVVLLAIAGEAAPLDCFASPSEAYRFGYWGKSAAGKLIAMT